jgi:hypothetical protein
MSKRRGSHVETRLFAFIESDEARTQIHNYTFFRKINNRSRVVSGEAFAARESFAAAVWKTADRCRFFIH